MAREGLQVALASLCSGVRPQQSRSGTFNGRSGLLAALTQKTDVARK